MPHPNRNKFNRAIDSLVAALDTRFPLATDVSVSIDDTAIGILATGVSIGAVEHFVRNRGTEANKALKEVCHILVEKLRKADPERQVQVTDLTVTFVGDPVEDEAESDREVALERYRELMGRVNDDQAKEVWILLTSWLGDRMPYIRARQILEDSYRPEQKA